VGLFAQSFGQYLKKLCLVFIQRALDLGNDQANPRFQAGPGLTGVKFVERVGKYPGDRQKSYQDDEQKGWVYLPDKSFSGHGAPTDGVKG
jgi:hypothetical protein